MGGNWNRISRRQLLLGAGAAVMTGACSRYKSGAVEAAGDGALRGRSRRKRPLADAADRDLASVHRAGPGNPRAGGYSETRVGDASDTSP